MTGREAIVALNLLPKIGPIRVQRLIEALGDPVAVLGAPLDRLRRVEGIGEETAAILHKWQDHADPVAEMANARERGIAIVTRDDADYPSPLREAYDPPLLLYVWGKLEARDKHAISVVGSRRTTHYGTKATTGITFQLAKAGFTIVSGLARGIDTSAHEAAVAAGGRTVAVIGSGLGKLFPRKISRSPKKSPAGSGRWCPNFPSKPPPTNRLSPCATASSPPGGGRCWWWSARRGRDR